jgi:hypothetical protein
MGYFVRVWSYSCCTATRLNTNDTNACHFIHHVSPAQPFLHHTAQHLVFMEYTSDDSDVASLNNENPMAPRNSRIPISEAFEYVRPGFFVLTL